MDTGDDDVSSMWDLNAIELDLTRVQRPLIAFIKQTHGVNKMSDIDMYRGCIPIHPYGRVQTVNIAHQAKIPLAEMPAEYTITPKAVPCKVTGKTLPRKPPTDPNTGMPAVYSTDAVYPCALKVSRFDNSEVPLDVALFTVSKPEAHKIKTLDRVMNNWGETGAAFTILTAGSTQDTFREQRRADASMGVAYRDMGFGVTSSAHLKCFAPLRQRHLLNGCLDLPPSVMDQAGLPYDTASTNPDAIHCWMLVPHNSLLTWPLADTDHRDRMEWGIYGVTPLRAVNKVSGELSLSYWVMPDVSVRRLVVDMDKVLRTHCPVDFGDIGVKMRPASCPAEPSWTDISVNAQVSMQTSAEEISAIMTTPRKIDLTYWVDYVIFPMGMQDAPNLSPELPPNWPKYSTFAAQTRPLIGGKLDDLVGDQKQRV